MLKHKIVVPVFIMLALAFLLSALVFKTALLGLGLVFLLFLAIVSWGAFDIRLGYFLPVYFRNSAEKNKRIAITFDDGPTIYTALILELLEQHQAKATFFCIGQQIEKYPNILKQAFDQQHLIGNHTYTHAKNTGFLSTEKMLEEITKNDRIIEAVIGVKPLLYRPPFGVTNPHVAKAVKRSGHAVIGWSIRSLDTVISDEKKILETVISKVKPGSVILFHDINPQTVRIVEQLLNFLSENEYQCVTVADLFKIKAYDDVVYP